MSKGHSKLKSPRKFQILIYLKKNPGSSYSEVAEGVGIEDSTCSSLLSHYKRQGLINNPTEWILTSKGKKRIEWMRSNGYTLQKAKKFSKKDERGRKPE